MAVLMLLMGVFSPIWMRAIDTAGTSLAQRYVQTEPTSSAAPAISTSTQTTPAVQEATK
jgi:NADH-quinone oxidoreductase subunit M